MKLTNIRAFEKHLKEAGPNHFAPVYMIVCAEEYETRQARALLTEALLGKADPGPEELKVFAADKCQVGNVVLELNSLGFFAPKRMVIVEQAEQFTKEQNAVFDPYFKNPAPGAYLLLLLSSINRATKFYKEAEKVGIILDIGEEKPWEKENSWVSKVSGWFQQEGKEVEPGVCQFFVKYVGLDGRLLQSEVDKLICYLGDKPKISKNDVLAICTGTNSENGWQLADALFKGDAQGALRIGNALLDEGESYFGLLRLMRSQMQSKLQIHAMLSAGAAPEEIQQKFPYMRGPILQQNVQSARQYGAERLKKAVLAIDEAELLAKSRSLAQQFLFEQLIFKLMVNV